jgi:hypothetical protein
MAAQPDTTIPRSIEFDMNKLISIFEKYAGKLQKDPKRLTDIYDETDKPDITDALRNLCSAVATNFMMKRRISDDGFDWTELDDAISKTLGGTPPVKNIFEE